MIHEQAEALLAETLSPLTTDAFFGAIGKTCLESHDGPAHPRRLLFGDDPKLTILNAFATHASNLDSHATAPTQPPPATTSVSSADEFGTLIRTFHQRGYTVRVPDVVPLAPKLQL